MTTTTRLHMVTDVAALRSCVSARDPRNEVRRVHLNEVDTETRFAFHWLPGGRQCLKDDKCDCRHRNDNSCTQGRKQGSSVRPRGLQAPKQPHRDGRKDDVRKETDWRCGEAEGPWSGNEDM